MLTIVIPMAGRGSRFSSAGYSDPKPLIPVNGKPMIQLVIENLTPQQEHRFVFICQREHVARYDLAAHFAKWAANCEIVMLDGLTEGAACTVLAASAFIDEGPLMIANSDQYVHFPIDAYLDAVRTADGLIMTMTADDPKWSFVALDDEGHVTRVVEKEVISNEATVGIYNFSRGLDFVDAAERMIAADERVNGEFYVAPVYNQMIQAGAKIVIQNVGSEGNGMYGLGTPADLNSFLATPLADKLAGKV